MIEASRPDRMSAPEPTVDSAATYLDSNGLTRSHAGGGVSIEPAIEDSLPSELVATVDAWQVILKQKFGIKSRAVRSEIYAAYLQKPTPDESRATLLARALNNAKNAKSQIDARSTPYQYASLVTNIEPTIAALETLIEIESENSISQSNDLTAPAQP